MSARPLHPASRSVPPVRSHTAFTTAIKIQNFALIYLCVWTIAPPMAFAEEYRYAAVAAALVWGVMELTRRDNILANPTAPIMLCVAYQLYTLGIEASLGTERYFDWHIQPAIMFFFLLVYESRRRDVETLAPVFWWTVASLPLWFALSLVGLSEHGHAARVFVRSSDEAAELAEQGVGGYGLVYFALTMLPILIALTLTRHRDRLQALPAQLKLLQGRLPLLTGASLALGVLFILRAQYSIAIYLGALAVAAMAVSRRRALAVLLISIPLATVAVQENSMVATLEFAQSMSQGTNVGRKIDDILTSVQADYAVGTLGDRLERYTRSLQLFAQAPIFGVLEFADVGKHSSYLDRFARYGLVGGVLFLYLLLYLPVRMMRRMNAGFGMAFSVFVIALLFPTLNTVFMGFGAALFIMFPVACSYLAGRSPDRFGIVPPRSRPGFLQPPARGVLQKTQRP